MIGFVSVQFLRPLADIFYRYNISLRDVERSLGLNFANILYEQDTLSIKTYCRLLDLLKKKSNNPAVGLELGIATHPYCFGMITYICVTSITLKEALIQGLRYQSLVSDICHMRHTERNNTFTLIFDFPYHHLPSQILEDENVSSIVGLARWLSNNSIPISTIYLQQPKPKNINRHQQAFACDLLFDQSTTAIELPTHLLNQPPNIDSELYDLEIIYCQNELISYLDNELVYSNEIAIEIISLIREGNPCLARLSEKLGISNRTIQRRLNDEDMTYTQLVDRIRQNLCQNYIENLNLSLIDIAYLLGFSEQSTFQRAFKRWTGTTPSQYRRSSRIS